jgi:hypothetical protein
LTSVGFLIFCIGRVRFDFRYLEDALQRLREEFLVIFKLEFIPESWRASLAYAVRGWLGCVLALYIAYFVQLDQPYWAGMTAWLAMQPTPGMALS